MVACVWRAVIPENKIGTFLKHCEQDVFPHYQDVPGLQNVELWARSCIGYAEVQVVSFWNSSEEMEKFSAEHPLQAIKIKHDYIVVAEPATTRYDVISRAGVDRRSDGLR